MLAWMGWDESQSVTLITYGRRQKENRKKRECMTMETLLSCIYKCADLSGGNNRPRNHSDSTVESIREGVLREGFAVVAEHCSGVPLGKALEWQLSLFVSEWVGE